MLDVAIHRSIGLRWPTAPRSASFDGELVSEEAAVVRALRGRLAHAGPCSWTSVASAPSTVRASAPSSACCAAPHPGTGRVGVCA